MSKDDDFFDQYVESNTSSKPKIRGSVKKDLFGATTKEKQEKNTAITNTEVKEEVKQEVKKTTKPRKTSVKKVEESEQELENNIEDEILE